MKHFTADQLAALGLDPSQLVDAEPDRAKIQAQVEKGKARQAEIDRFIDTPDHYEKFLRGKGLEYTRQESGKQVVFTFHVPEKGSYRVIFEEDEFKRITAI